MSDKDEYEAFLKNKILTLPDTGISGSIEIDAQLFPHQAVGTRWALRRGRAALFFDTGLGKSISELTWCQRVSEHTKGMTILFAPLAVSEQFVYREAPKFGIAAKVVEQQSECEVGVVNVTNYEKLHRFDPTAFTGVCIDECFAAGTMVEVVGDDNRVSSVPIETIRVGWRILNAQGVDVVADVHRREVPYGVIVKVAGEDILCSPNHPFFTQRGWVGAQDIEPGDHVVRTRAAVRMVQGDLCAEDRTGAVLHAILRSEMAQHPTAHQTCAVAPDAGLRMVQSAVHAEEPGRSILQPILFGQVEDEHARASRESAYAGSSGEAGAGQNGVVQGGQPEGRGREGTHPSAQPNADAGGLREDLPHVESDGPRTFRAWGQRSWFDSTAADSAGCAWTDLDGGICLVVGPTAGGLSDALQARLGASRAASVHRGGWRLALREEGTGREEGCDASVARVDGLEVLEPTDPRLERLRTADGRLYFYDLGATRHPSFSVNGLLVHNSSILKSMTGSTKEALIRSFASTPYRLAASATPSPNDHKELGNHSEFLGIMTAQEMLAMFFVHDGGSTSDWRLKDHARDSFWRWVSSWGLMVKKPSDLGFDDTGYDLPPLVMHEHVVEMPENYHKAQGLLVATEARTLTERRVAKRASLAPRVAACAARVNDSPDQWMVWAHLNDEADALEKAIPGSIQVAGSDKPEDKKKRLIEFADGKIRVLISKAKIAGFGMNFQNCHQTAFVGLNESHEQLYQCIRRFYRFGQKSTVDVHLYLSEAETATLRDLKTKEAKAEEMAHEMVAATRAMSRENVLGATKEVTPYKRDVARGKSYTLYLGDSIEQIRSQATESVDFTIFSPPFASLYTYSNSERDLGNCANHAEFYEHFRFLVREIYRTTKPGRLCSFHCMDLPTLKYRDGFIGIEDFRGILVKAYQNEGWILHSQTTIWKDPVTAMQRTKAKGLLYKTLRGDSTNSRNGLPDYLVTMKKPGEVPDSDETVMGDYQNAVRGLCDALGLGKTRRDNARALDAYLRLHAELVPSYLVSMRKPGDNATPVTHTPETFNLDEWQKIASPIWMDINASDTLQHRSVREDADERHICPLQTEVIRRALKLYSNPGDVVASWFAGIGSEGVVSLEMGRQFVGCELKESYWKQAAANLAATEEGPKQMSMF